VFIEYIAILLVVTSIVATPVPAIARLLGALRTHGRIPDAGVLAAIAAVVLGEHLTLVVADAAYLSRTVLLRPERDLPIKLMGFRDSYHLAPQFGTQLLAIALVQAIALAVIAIAMQRPTRARAIAIGIGAAVAAGEALTARIGTSGDIYSNVGYALLGTRSYLPPNVPFAGTFAPISQWWGTPLVPAPYGPLWILTLHVATAIGATLFAKIVVLRVLGIVSIVADVALLRALRFSPATLALVALNPALTFEYVLNVHNDLFAVALLLGSRLACERERPRLGVLLAIAAGLIKLPFAFFAAATFETTGDRRTRLVSLAITFGATLVLSYVLTGGAMFAGIAHHLREHVPAAGAMSLVLSAESVARVFAIVALVALACTAFWTEGIVYAIPLIGIHFLPWYAAWSLPYAALRERALITFLLVLPVIRIVVDFTLASGDAILVFQKVVLFVLIVTSLLFAFRRVRRPATAR
jgi:hypothetical protein